MTARPRLLLALASIAVAFAAADTYVVVLALPDMMNSTGIPIDQLQRAAPIISGFLLGYVAMLPLIGRIADLRGRVPVLVAALVLFADRFPGHHARLRHADPGVRALPAGRGRRRFGAGHPGAGGRPVPRPPTRRSPRDRLRGAGARQRDRPAVRRGGPRRRGLARDLPDQPCGRPGAGCGAVPPRRPRPGAGSRPLRRAAPGRPGRARVAGHHRARRRRGLRPTQRTPARPDLGAAVHPGDRERSLADARWACSPSSLPCSCCCAVCWPRARWWTSAPGGAPRARPTSSARRSWPSPWVG